jgi:biotin carboxylase
MRILIVNRWDDEFADYGTWVDHRDDQVFYVTIRSHLPLVPPDAVHVEVVEDIADAAQVTAAADLCHRRAGGFERVLCLSEFDLLTGAALRERYDVPGDDVERTLNFRDKPRMKQVLGARGVRVPGFREVDGPQDVAEFAAAAEGGLMLKPRSGAASQGCLALPRGTDLAEALAGLDLRGYEVEEFLDGPIWHVDGLMYQGELRLGRASRYINTCYDFAHGTPLGSVVQAGALADQVVDFARHCLQVLGMADGIFHLEVIETASGLAFLEVGARVGGGEIPFTFRDVYGVDLLGDWVQMELGRPPRTVPGGNAAEHAGFLMIPEPVGYRVAARTPVLGTVEGLYAELLPDVGHVFDGHGGYDVLLGRFRYRGASAEAVQDAIEATLKQYRYELDRVEADGIVEAGADTRRADPAGPDGPVGATDRPDLARRA